MLLCPISPFLKSIFIPNVFVVYADIYYAIQYVLLHQQHLLEMCTVYPHYLFPTLDKSCITLVQVGHMSQACIRWWSDVQSSTNQMHDCLKWLLPRNSLIMVSSDGKIRLPEPLRICSLLLYQKVFYLKLHSALITIDIQLLCKILADKSIYPDPYYEDLKRWCQSFENFEHNNHQHHDHCTCIIHIDLTLKGHYIVERLASVGLGSLIYIYNNK